MTKIFLSFILSIFTFSNNAQNESFQSNLKPKSIDEKNLNIILEIEQSIKNSDVLKLVRFINAQTYFSMMGNINGYYTTNQAYYMLEDFFKINKVQFFKFTQISSDTNNPYATGVLQYENKGRRSKAQVYISLRKIGDNWIISQLSIN
jgi:hypothetical protein